jgi:hypothetical protein
MNVPRYLSWDNFRSTVLIPGQQRVHRVTDSPLIEVFGDGITNRIGMWLEISPETSIPPELTKLAFISTRVFNEKGRFILEIATATDSLLREFYHFTVAVTERMFVEKQSAMEAVALEFQCFTDLLVEKPHLGIERQIGLVGELIFLERLITNEGLGALDSWLGPIGEPHDFRLRVHEFEVKTTLSPYRVHVIHGMEQLVPSKGCSLYLVSVLLGPPGASDGFSLSQKVSELSGLFESTPARLAQFTTALEASGFRTADAGLYTRRFAMRRPMGLVAVDNSFPAVTRPTIQKALGPLSSRVESLQYDVDVEGLEFEEGTSKFNSVIAA